MIEKAKSASSNHELPNGPPLARSAEAETRRASLASGGVKIDEVYTRLRWKWLLVCGGLVIGLLATLIICISVGPVSIPKLTVIKILLYKIGLVRELSGLPEHFIPIVFDVRLPRILLGGLVGIALATSGCAMQAIFRNPMAGPYIIGISSGAAFGAALFIVLGVAPFIIPLPAFVFALITAFLVYYIARVHGKVPVERLLLSGIAISLFFSAMLSLVEYVAGEQELRTIVFWLMGGLWTSTWEKVGLCFLPILIGTGAMLLFSRDLDVMLTGEEQAVDLGVEVEKVRKLILVFASLATAGAVSMVGIIGFVGLMIPHLLRLLVGPEHKLLLPASALAGAIFLVWTDLLARNLIAPSELPVGIITASLGAPFFLWLLRSRKKEMGW